MRLALLPVSRQLLIRALLWALIGALAMLFVLILFHDQAMFWQAALLCGGLG